MTAERVIQLDAHRQRRPALGDGPARLYREVYALAPAGYCSLTQDELAERLDTTARTIRSWTDALKGAGMIETRRTARGLVYVPLAPLAAASGSHNQPDPVASGRTSDHASGWIQPRARTSSSSSSSDTGSASAHHNQPEGDRKPAGTGSGSDGASGRPPLAIRLAAIGVDSPTWLLDALGELTPDDQDEALRRAVQEGRQPARTPQFVMRCIETVVTKRSGREALERWREHWIAAMPASEPPAPVEDRVPSSSAGTARPEAARASRGWGRALVLLAGAALVARRWW